MSAQKLFLRKTVSADVDILYRWVNDKAARQNAFDSHVISLDEHEAWFQRIMEDPDSAQYILMSEKGPVGQVRLTIEGTNAEIDYSISNSERGSGYGREIIRLIIEKTREDYPFVQRLIGRVKPSNAVSLLCLTKNGFTEKYRQLEYDMSQDKRTQFSSDAAF